MFNVIEMKNDNTILSIHQEGTCTFGAPNGTNSGYCTQMARLVKTVLKMFFIILKCL